MGAKWKMYEGSVDIDLDMRYKSKKWNWDKRVPLIMIERMDDNYLVSSCELHENTRAYAAKVTHESNQEQIGW